MASFLCARTSVRQRLSPIISSPSCQGRLFSTARDSKSSRSSPLLRTSAASLPLGIRCRRNLTVSAVRRGLFSSGTKKEPEPLSAAPPADSPAHQPLEVASRTESVPDAPPTDLLPDAAQTTVENLSLVPATIPPIQYGDLEALGLTSWSPIGLSAWALEIINVSTGLPWLQTIVCGTVLSRLIIFPMSIASMREAAKMAPITPQLNLIREEIAEASKTQNRAQLQRAALMQRKLLAEAGAKPGRMLFFNIMPLPISLGMFFAVKRLCEFPLEQLKTGGLEAFGGAYLDLTAQDPTYVLPAIVVAVVNLQIRLAARDMQTNGQPHMLHIINAFHVLSLVSFPLMAKLSIGVLFNIIASVIFYAAQVILLRTPAIRRALKIPALPQHMKQKVPSFVETFKFGKNWYAQRVKDAQAAQGKKW
ncbi:hypothetical protein GLOTRDRAFT_76107 [Gloeophyllum trabeum ATCC 11539]|uniref:Membrane insertase YidC/Oxa/ALB C-terminal domain-containing protein n=1 Tax=Gloeophyllum trabeum (strain ATCC 11539 / FP-39264 / Madison 617) TaxID=670483 RepID=S7RN32_GLOTA|nr:uncharacterized protein GLOTRDRAFT_76107 [Gloeophyllum trabeum ATCC 11539]EPQ55875.1 hypothetical protein GLOTRDRAFT_76107 [Gloeophyllum trabeum ATCC 11539]